MTRLPLILLVCLLAWLPPQASARLMGPPESWQLPGGGRDLAQIRSSGQLRVLINQSRNSSGEVKGQSIGVEHHRLQAFLQYLNRNARSGRNIELKLIPRPKDQLLGALLRGEGDLVAPGEMLEVRQGQPVVATEPFRSQVPLVVVSRQGNRRYRSLEQLAGRSLLLPAGSAVSGALKAVNRRLAERNLEPLAIEWVDSSLAVEDVLEMVQAGIFPRTAVEQPIAERWAKVMPKLRIDRHLVLSSDGDISWFVRRDAPMLHASVDRFARTYHDPENLDADFQRVYRRLYRVHSPLGRQDLQRLEKVRPVLQKHAEQTGLDWLMLAALAFKESTLNPAARGAGGATGLMQITPAAARSVGVGNVQLLDNNVLAGSRYLAKIRRTYFSSPQINDRERMAFTLAAYNLGPERVQALRAEARRRGLNGNQWFFQVERVAMEQLGMGVVSYVGAVNKYYLAYDRERDWLEPRGKGAVSQR
ncbi:transglycosylase SLT domain-containing protein [Zestomonas thermotolerans]|uniref:transglycosylase SLT domain-containing protein n=1 Tax=Zestomonas thermotolerans TaxID=157784 RepID=UPI0023F1A33B|nr:transglycosylase SLT domain-containing protein [Pseudomonas thermotolerans]MBO2509568.1 lytic transglycosylase F [Gammaproteobacteria bacterium]